MDKLGQGTAIEPDPKAQPHQQDYYSQTTGSKSSDYFPRWKYEQRQTSGVPRTRSTSDFTARPHIRDSHERGPADSLEELKPSLKVVKTTRNPLRFY